MRDRAGPDRPAAGYVVDRLVQPEVALVDLMMDVEELIREGRGDAEILAALGQDDPAFRGIVAYLRTGPALDR